MTFTLSFLFTLAPPSVWWLFLSADLIGSCIAVPGTFLIRESIARVGNRSFDFSCRLVRRVACEPYLWLDHGSATLVQVCRS